MILKKYKQKPLSLLAHMFHCLTICMFVYLFHSFFAVCLQNCVPIDFHLFGMVLLDPGESRDEWKTTQDTDFYLLQILILQSVTCFIHKKKKKKLHVNIT